MNNLETLLDNLRYDLLGEAREKTVQVKFAPSTEPEEKELVKLPSSLRAKVDNLSSGSYQEALLSGEHSWSGSSLKGQARKYKFRYIKSMEKFLNAIKNAASSAGWSADTMLVKVKSKWLRQLVFIKDDKVALW